MKRLVVGPGPAFERKQGDVLYDIVEVWGDVKIDISKENFPDKDETFDEIEVHHCLEHVQLNEDFLHVMREMHRVLKFGGTIDITVPHKDTEAAYDCFQHTRFFNENSFMNFYDNVWYKEMELPYFKCLLNERRFHSEGCDEVHVILQK